MKKNILALVLSTILCVSAFPVTGMAAGFSDSDAGIPVMAAEEEASEGKAEASAASEEKKVGVSWKAFSWIEHDQALVTLIADADGTCYYKWVERNEDGTSTTPKMDTGVSHMMVNKDKSFVINLRNLSSDKKIDLYVKVLSTDGRTSKLWRIKLNENTRPAPKPAHIPVIPKVSESVVKGLESPLKFTANKFYEFTVIGAGTTNKNPGKGDVKWVPLYWSMTSYPKDSGKYFTWKIGSPKEINKTATYNMYIFFRKYVYTDSGWWETDTVESACYQFRSVALSNVKLSTPVLSGISNNSSGIVLKWRKVSNASGYKIYRKTGSSSKWDNIATVKGNGTQMYIDGSVKAGTLYTYTVRAYKGSSVSACNKNGLRTVRMTAPALYTPASKASGKITVRWKKTASVSGYQIQYSVSKKFSKAKTVSTSSLTRTLSGVKKGASYYVRVRAYKKISGKMYYSPWSSVKNVKVRK